MNIVMLNNVSLDGDAVIKRGGGSGGGTTGGGGNTGGGGTAPVSKGDVTFYDYDGTILHGYTKDEFLALTAMPELPTREGLICQEWNWDFDEAIAYVSEYGILDVGATYITDDGKTRFYITIESKVVSEITLNFSLPTPNSLVIDWGDGVKDAVSGTGDNMNAVHKYEDAGDYVIAFEVAEGAIVIFKTQIFGSNNVYTSMLKKVEIGNGVISMYSKTFASCYSLSSIVLPKSMTNIDTYTFSYCYSLSSIVLPKGMTSIDAYAFISCSSLSSIVMPQSVKSVSSNAFQYCSSLASVVIPEGVNRIGIQTFASCYSLSSIVIPQGVTNIGGYGLEGCYPLSSIVMPQSMKSIDGYALSSCRSLVILDFSKSTSVPTLSSTGSIPSQAELRIIVPDDLYDTWIAATNWSSHASKIIKKSYWDASQA